LSANRKLSQRNAAPRLTSDGWRNIPISLIDPDFGEQTAQAGENA
jgi:hypothetical protein